MQFVVKDCRKISTKFYSDVKGQLSLQQKDKIERLKYGEDRILSLLGLALASELSDVPIDKILYVGGKPTVRGRYLSITHKYPYVGVVASERPVGIDIETIREIDKTTVDYLGAKDSLSALIEWTRKESIYKMGDELKPNVRTIIIDHSIVLSISN